MTNKELQKQHMRKIAKRTAVLSLCALMAGGLVVGSNAFAAGNKENQVTLLKSENKDDDSSNAAGSLDVSDVAESGMKSVVAITTMSVQEVSNYFGSFSYGGYAPSQEQEVESAGSGIIIGKDDDNYYMVTNYHVVEDANTVSVTFSDNETYEATVRGYDADKDLAIVSVPIEDIKSSTEDAIEVATIGSSDDLKIGEQVVAIGNAMGYGQSVTTGIVSAKNCVMDDSEIVSSTEDEDAEGTNLIQTDAAINPGNSGGALLNMDGEVVGINCAKLADTTVEGMGYAIAISDVEDLIERMVNEEPREEVENHGFIGITGQTVDESGTAYGIPEGVYIQDVTEDSGADEAGLKEGYVITYFDGKRVKTIQELVDLLAYYEPGEEIEVTYESQSEDGYAEHTTTVTLGEGTETSDDEDSEDDEDMQESEAPDEKSEDGSDESDEYNDFEDWYQNSDQDEIEDFFRQYQEYMR